MPAFPRRTYQVGQTVRLKPGTQFTQFGMTGVIREVRDGSLRLNIGVHLVWVPLEKVIQP
jgi:hypothetical protein